MERERNVITYEARDGQQISLSFDTIKKYLVQGHPEWVTSQEMMLYMGINKSRGLNPFIKDCYLIKYSQKDAAAIITSIDYFRKRSKAQKDCKGWAKGIIVERNGEIVYSAGLMLDSDTLLGGWFEAQPDGWEKPFKLEVNLKGYIKKKADGSVTKFWSKDNQPSQIAKVAESQGLRTLWPDEFQQLYTPEEMGDPDMFETTATVIKQESAADKLKGKGAETREDIYKTQEAETPEKPKEKKTVEETPEEKDTPDPGPKVFDAEDAIRTLYLGKDLKGLTSRKFAIFLKSHTAAIPGMAPEYQDEIKKEHARLFPGQDFPVLIASDPPPKQDKPKGTEKSESPIMLNCMLDYEVRPEKNDDGHVSVDVCDNVCKSKDKCVAYTKYVENISGNAEE